MNTPLLAPNPHCRSVESSLSRLFAILDDVGSMDPDSAAIVIQDADIDPLDLAPWNDLDHPLRDSYGRQLVRRGPKFELMVMSWMPGDYSAIHDHGIAEWGAVQYFGAADHIIFKERDGVLSIDQRMTMPERSVYAVDHSLIHLMGNRGDTPFISLHLYGRTDPAESITGSARVFDLWEQCIQRTNGGVFFYLPEAEILWREDGPGADQETTRLHHQLMLNRLERVLATEDDSLPWLQRAHQLREAIARLSSTSPDGKRCTV